MGAINMRAINMRATNMRAVNMRAINMRAINMRAINMRATRIHVGVIIRVALRPRVHVDSVVVAGALPLHSRYRRSAV